jgi:hypothetical protein
LVGIGKFVRVSVKVNVGPATVIVFEGITVEVNVSVGMACVFVDVLTGVVVFENVGV